MFSVGSDGTLSEVGGSPVTIAGEPDSVAFSRSGGLLATANYSGSNVSVFSVGSDGTLTPVAGSPFPAGAAPYAVAFSPSGGLLATANGNVTTASVFSVGSHGALTQVAGRASEAGLGFGAPKYCSCAAHRHQPALSGTRSTALVCR